MKFRVIKSKRRTLCLSVEKNGEVLVRAPYSAGDTEIENFVMRHGRWIAARLAKRTNRRELCLGDGETVTLFGERYEIGEGKKQIGNGKIYLPVSGRQQALLECVKALTKEKMAAFVNEISARFGFEYSRIRVSSARTRWGSCSKRSVLSFSCFLAFVDPASSYYVAVHELCHTRYFNHGKNFWHEVEKVLPDWRKRRSKLRREEDCLDYLRFSG